MILNEVELACENDDNILIDSKEEAFVLNKIENRFENYVTYQNKQS